MAAGDQCLLFDDLKESTGPVIEIDDNKGRDFIRMTKSGTEVCRINKHGEIVSNSGWKTRTIHVCLGDIAANEDGNLFPIFRAPVPVTIKTADFATDTSVALDTTDYQSISICKKAGAGATERTVAAAITTASAGFTLNTWRASGTIDTDYSTILPNETVYIKFAKSGNGMALSGFTVRIEYNIVATSTDSNTDAQSDPVIEFAEPAKTDGTIISDQTVRDHISFKEGGTEVFGVDLEGIMTQPRARDRYFVDVFNLGDYTKSDDADHVFCLMITAGRIVIDKVYIGSTETYAADSDSNYVLVSIKNGTSKIVERYISGPYAAGLALTAGIFEDMGDLHAENADMASGETLKLSFTETGAGEDIDSLTIAVAYRKLD